MSRLSRMLVGLIFGLIFGMGAAGVTVLAYAVMGCVKHRRDCCGG